MILDKFPSESKRITTAATTVIKATEGILRGITITKILTGTVTIKDGTTTIAILPIGTPVGDIMNTAHGIGIAGALSIVTSAADELTVFYR
jgi:hypothetical protein